MATSVAGVSGSLLPRERGFYGDYTHPAGATHAPWARAAGLSSCSGGLRPLVELCAEAGALISRKKGCAKDHSAVESGGGDV